jgi:hypothetical protein
MRLIVQHDVQQRAVNLKMAIVVDETHFTEFVHEWLTRERVVPTIFASVSWLTLAMTFCGLPSFPKFANSSKARASRFSPELNSWSIGSASTRIVRATSRLLQGEHHDRVSKATMSKVPNTNNAGADHPRYLRLDIRTFECPA